MYKIHDRTLQDSLCWQETVDEGVFLVSFQNATIKIFRVERDDGQADILIRVYNQKASLIEEISDSDFFHSNDRDLGNSAYKYMEEIYFKARSQSLGVEEVINGILSELGDDLVQSTGDEIPF